MAAKVVPGEEKHEAGESDPQAASSWSGSFKQACTLCYITVILQSGRADENRTVWPAFPFGVYIYSYIKLGGNESSGDFWGGLDVTLNHEG